MTQDYVSYIRSKVGHATIIMTFTGGILADEEGRVLLQLRGIKKPGLFQEAPKNFTNQPMRPAVGNSWKKQELL